MRSMTGCAACANAAYCSSPYPFRPLRLRRQRQPRFGAAQRNAVRSCAQPPPGCNRYTVELRKPLGLVLEEDRHGSIFVVRDREVLFRVCLQTQPHCSHAGVTPGRRLLAGAQAGSLREACGCGACLGVPRLCCCPLLLPARVDVPCVRMMGGEGARWPDDQPKHRRARECRGYGRQAAAVAAGCCTRSAGVAKIARDNSV